MTKPRFQSPVLLDAEGMAFIHFAIAKGLGKSRTDVIRKLLAARRIQYQAVFNSWLVSPEGRSVLRAEGLGGLVGPSYDSPEPELIEDDEA